MRTILVLFAAPAMVGALVGSLIRLLFRRKGWGRAWLPFAAALCFAAMDTGAIWYAEVRPRTEGWGDLAALITGAMLLTFSLSGLLVTAPGRPRGGLSRWEPPASPRRAALRTALGYGLGTLLLSAAVFLLGATVGFSPEAGKPGLAFPAYVLFFVLAYPLLGFFLCRWLSCERASLPAVCLGLLFWLVVLLGLGLLIWSNNPWLSRWQSSPWGQLYGRINFPAALCLGDYRSALPNPGLELVIAMSCLPPVLFGIGWLAGRRVRRG